MKSYEEHVPEADMEGGLALLNPGSVERMLGFPCLLASR